MPEAVLSHISVFNVLFHKIIYQLPDKYSSFSLDQSLKKDYKSL
jgi:hypothetical protein